jgi:hypothetical protein
MDESRESRRDLLKKGAFAAAVWTVPTVLTVSAARAESAAPCVITNQDVSSLCSGMFPARPLVAVHNPCQFPIVVNGMVFQPGQDDFAPLPNPPFFETDSVDVFVFAADASGQPTGAPLFTLVVHGCARVP